jgi:hypothetical protein
MEALDGLFEADGDEQANDDGGDVDEEVGSLRVGERRACGLVPWASRAA